jgi:hypothetical protein
MQNFDYNMFFEQSFSPKMANIAENCDHNIERQTTSQKIVIITSNAGKLDRLVINILNILLDKGKPDSYCH